LAGELVVWERDGGRSDRASKLMFWLSALVLLKPELFRGGWRVTTDSDTFEASDAFGTDVSAEDTISNVGSVSGVRSLAAVCKYDRG